MHTHLNEIKAFCRHLNQRHLILVLGLAIADWAIVWGILAAVEAWIDPVQESTAAVLLLVSIPSIAGLWIWAYQRHKSHFQLSPKRLANRIETAQPALNDLLVTAADIEGRPDHTPNGLEGHVLESAAKELRQIDWKALATHPLERGSVSIGVLILSLVMTALASQSTPMRKALFSLNDAWQGSSSGLVLAAHPDEVPIGSNVSVGAAINRWQREAAITWTDSRGRHREAVVIGANGEGTFTFYDAREVIRYRIESPSLRSDWQTIEVYIPARIDDANIIVSPPAYTGLDTEQVNGLQDLKVLEGSRVAFRISSKQAASLSLQMAETAHEFIHLDKAIFETSVQVEQSTAYFFTLTDPEGRVERSPTHQLEVYPDQPPVVEILEPKNDSVLAPDQVFPLSLYAADDYGLARLRLHLELTGSGETVLELPLKSVSGDDPMDTASSPITEAEIQSAISLADLQATDGEFLSMYVELADNREPEPNITQSDLVFIEIRTPVPPIEKDGMPMERKEINLRELIDEQKRLLRETHRLETTAEKDRLPRMQEIVSGLGVLGAEINRIFEEVRMDLLAANQLELIDLFQHAMETNREAIRQLEKRQARESFEPQSASLSDLLKLENAFRDNTFTKKPTEGSGKGKSGEGKKPNEQAGEEPINQQAEALKAAKAALEEMIAGQNQLNTEYDRAARSDWPADAAAEQAAAQQELAEEAQALESSLRSLSEAAPLRGALSGAGDQMRSASVRAGQEDASGALRSGMRAREALRMAAAELDALLADAAGRQLEDAARMAAELARQQAEAAQSSAKAASEGATAAELAALEAAQRSLKDDYEAFLDALEEQSRQSAGSEPEASQAMSEAASKARNGPTGSNMERSANALLYGQPSLAGPLQSSASQQLAGMAESLAEARNQMANNPVARAHALNRELQSTLEELASYARQPEMAPPDRLPEIREDWVRRLEELREISGDVRFGGLSGQLGRAEAGTWDGELAQARQVLQDSARVLRQFLFDQATFSELQMNRDAAPPPDQYRQMVEEYFRRLANEPTESP